MLSTVKIRVRALITTTAKPLMLYGRYAQASRASPEAMLIE
jgi:hypothetical protein